MRIDVRTEHEVTGIDLAARKVEVHNRAPRPDLPARLRPACTWPPGPGPAGPTCPGSHLPHVHGVQTLEDAAALLSSLKAPVPAPRRVVVIGSGYIGLEMAEAFVNARDRR